MNERTRILEAMTGILCALLSSVFISASQLALRKSYREFVPSVAFLFDAIFGLLIWIPLAVFMGISGSVSWSDAIVYAVISAILSEAIVFYALSRGTLAVTATIIASYPVYTLLFSRLINHEILTPVLMVFIACAVAGSIIASMPEKLKKSEISTRVEIVWPFIAAVCIGLSDTISKGYINRSGDFSFLYALGFVQIPVALAYLAIERQSLAGSVRGVIRLFGNYRYSLLGGLFNIIGTGFLWLSFSFAPASIASPITGTNGVITVLVSRMIFRERISARKTLGIILTFIGIIGITVFRQV